MRRAPFAPVQDNQAETSVKSETRPPASKKPAPPPLILPAITTPGAGALARTVDEPVESPSPVSNPVAEQADERGQHQSLPSSAAAHAYEVVYISAHDIDPNRFAPREIYGDNTLQERADSLEANGQRDPIHVIPNPAKPGRFIIGDGWTRVQAVRMRDILNLQLKAIIHTDKSEEEIAWMGYAQNEEREAHTDFDRAKFYQKWRDQGWTWEQISKKTGIPVGSLSQYGNYSKLDVDILHYAKRHPEKVTVNVVNQLWRLVSAKKSAEAAISLCKTFVDNDESFRWLKERVDSLTMEQRPDRKSSPVKFQRRYEHGHFKQRSDGKIEIVGMIAQDKLEQFNETMDKLLRPYFGSEEPSNINTPTDNQQ